MESGLAAAQAEAAVMKSCESCVHGPTQNDDGRDTAVCSDASEKPSLSVQLQSSATFDSLAVLAKMDKTRRQDEQVGKLACRARECKEIKIYSLKEPRSCQQRLPSAGLA